MCTNIFSFFFWPIWGCPRPQFSTTFRIPSIYILSSTTIFLFFFFYFLSHNNYGTRTYYTATVIISLWHYNERKFYKPKSKLRWTLLTLMSVLRVKPPSTIINRPYELPRIVYMGVYKTFFFVFARKRNLWVVWILVHDRLGVFCLLRHRLAGLLAIVSKK